MKKQSGKIQLPVSGKKVSLGVALEEHALIFVEAAATSRGVTISRFGEIALETERMEKDFRTEELKQVLASLHRRAKTKALRIALPDSAATFFEMTLPESDPFLLDHMIEREIKKAIGDRHEFIMQSEILYKEKNLTKVAVTMLPQMPIDELKAIARSASFRLDYVGLSTEIVAELVGLDDAASIIVSIGEHETAISILSKGSLVLEDVISTGTNIWVEKIMNAFGISREGAEEALFFDGISLSGSNALVTVLRSELLKITETAEKIFLYWHVDCRKEKECRVREVTLVGAGATVPGIAGYLENALHIETRTPEPFKKVPLENEVPELTEAESLRYLPALAVALQGLRKK